CAADQGDLPGAAQDLGGGAAAAVAAPDFFARPGAAGPGVLPAVVDGDDRGGAPVGPVRAGWALDQRPALPVARPGCRRRSSAPPSVLRRRHSASAVSFPPGARGCARNGTATGDSGLSPCVLPPAVVLMRACGPVIGGA